MANEVRIGPEMRVVYCAACDRNMRQRGCFDYTQECPGCGRTDDYEAARETRQREVYTEKAPHSSVARLVMGED